MSVTLLAGPLAGSLDDHAQSFLAGNTLASSRQEQRQGLGARSYLYGSPDGHKQYRLLLIEERGKVYGLYAQGDAEPFADQAALVERMFDSLTLERPALYPEQRDARFAYALRIPPSWHAGRSLATGDRRMAQYLSPTLAIEAGQALNASLTITVERLEPEADLEEYYRATRKLLGESFQQLDHVRWRDGYADVMKTETPLATARLRRYYRVAAGRGYSLAFEAREDVFQNVAPWFELIAGTLKVGPEASTP